MELHFEALCSIGAPDIALKIQLADGTSENYHNLEEDAPLNVKPVGKLHIHSAKLRKHHIHPAKIRKPHIRQTKFRKHHIHPAKIRKPHIRQAKHLKPQNRQAKLHKLQISQAKLYLLQILLGTSDIVNKISESVETMLAEPAGNQPSAFVDTMQDLPKTFTQVKVVLTNSSSNYWVQRVDQETALNGILLALFNQTLKTLPVKLEIGQMCVGYYENHW
ncbi:unnamed protein product, partial [Timema podura]|nr:unnamed protein product [Timema podura]